MRTEEEFFTQLATSEIFCPCDQKCVAKPTKLPPAFAAMPIPWVHKTYDNYMTCLCRYVAEFVKDRIRELRATAAEELEKHKLGWYWITNDHVNPMVFVDAIKELKIHFASTNGELDKLLISRFFVLCELAIRKAATSG